jgi:hypothetical protein
MPYLARTRAGVKEFLAHAGGSRHLWLGKNVLSDEEIELIRQQGNSVTVFAHEIESQADVADALLTLQDHHPHEAAWAECKPDNANPRSADIGQAFLWREWIANTIYEHNTLVTINEGPNVDQRGSLVSVVELSPEPTYIVELESGFDIQAKQTWLKPLPIQGKQTNDQII